MHILMRKLHRSCSFARKIGKRRCPDSWHQSLLGALYSRTREPVYQVADMWYSVVIQLHSHAVYPVIGTGLHMIVCNIPRRCEKRVKCCELSA